MAMIMGPESKPKKGSFDRYQVEDAAHILRKHREIKADPKLHNAAVEHMRNQGKGFRMLDMGKKKR